MSQGIRPQPNRLEKSTCIPHTPVNFRYPVLRNVVKTFSSLCIFIDDTKTLGLRSFKIGKGNVVDAAGSLHRSLLPAGAPYWLLIHAGSASPGNSWEVTLFLCGWLTGNEWLSHKCPALLPQVGITLWYNSYSRNCRLGPVPSPAPSTPSTP